MHREHGDQDDRGHERRVAKPMLVTTVTRALIRLVSAPSSPKGDSAHQDENGRVAYEEERVAETRREQRRHRFSIDKRLAEVAVQDARQPVPVANPDWVVEMELLMNLR